MKATKNKKEIENKTGKTAFYIRVSTDAQREEGYSIDAQKDKALKYCALKDITDYDFYIDGGFTGSNLDRPDMERLIGDIKNSMIDCVVVYKLDRLSRSQKDTLYLLEEVFNPFGVAFVSIEENFDTSTATGRAMLGIISVFAQLERENIRERTRMGMLERVKSGLWPGGGRIPYGYDYDSTQGILVPNAQAENVRKIYDLYLEGNSPAKIAAIMGMKYDNQVTGILSKKTNAGYIPYNGEFHKGLHEALVTLDTYQRTMDMMLDRSTIRETSGNHLFTGLIHCGNCEAKMRYQKWNKKSGECKIICYSQQKSKLYLVKDPDCDNARQWAGDVEDAVIKDLFSFSVRLSETENKKSSDLSVAEMLNRRYDETSKKLKRLYSLYSGAPEEEEEEAPLLESINDLKKQLHDIRRQLEVEQERNAISGKIERVKKSLETLKETWEFMTADEKKNLIRSCIEKIVITGDNVEVYYKFGTLGD